MTINHLDPFGCLLFWLSLPPWEVSESRASHAPRCRGIGSGPQDLQRSPNGRFCSHPPGSIRIHQGSPGITRGLTHSHIFSYYGHHGHIKIAETGGNKVSFISSTSHVHFPGNVKFTFAVFPASVKLLQGSLRLEVKVLPLNFWGLNLKLWPIFRTNTNIKIRSLKEREVSDPWPESSRNTSAVTWELVVRCNTYMWRNTESVDRCWNWNQSLGKQHVWSIFAPKGLLEMMLTSGFFSTGLPWVHLRILWQVRPTSNQTCFEMEWNQDFHIHCHPDGLQLLSQEPQGPQFVNSRENQHVARVHSSIQ